MTATSPTRPAQPVSPASDCHDIFGARATLGDSSESVVYYRIQKLEEDGLAPVSRLPYAIKVLLEAALRQCDGQTITREDVLRIARWQPENAGHEEIPFKPARVVMQDFTGVPALVDLAAMRDAMAALGGDAQRLNPAIPVDVVIDHSVQVDCHADPGALRENTRLEMVRNRERYRFLRWAQKAFQRLRVVPPGMGIVHQVNLEFLADVVSVRDGVAFPDSLVGTDSHTPMINGLGVVGWGVGGIEAEAVMLGEPISMLLPRVVGVRLEGCPPPETTATDIVLSLTQRLRQHGVVGQFVEFYGPGLQHLSLADRATIANMTPEFGATLGLFPVDAETLAYLSFSGRPPATIGRVQTYLQAQGMLCSESTPEPLFNETLVFDLHSVRPCVAGPRRPQDRIPLEDLKVAVSREHNRQERTPSARQAADIPKDAVAIAAITSCTNTSNPAVMIGAGLLARNAVRRGLSTPAHVKTSLAPGSRVVTRYLAAAGLDRPLEALGFHTVAYGCTTCIGNSGPLCPATAAAVEANGLAVHCVLSGNRNFEGRIHPLAQGSYLMSPPLVVAFALAGRMDIDFAREPLGRDAAGVAVHLSDIWPSREVIQAVMAEAIAPAFFRETYAHIFEGDADWTDLPTPDGLRYVWEDGSSYIRRPPFLEGIDRDPPPLEPLRGARALLLLGDNVTTDHISPAGAIAADSPAGDYLRQQAIAPADWNSYGARRGNHEVMVRGSFANPRLRNALTPDLPGGMTRHFPDGAAMTVFDAAQAYRREGVPAIVLAGRDYGAGSSRDWAAKGPWMLGVRAVVAQSFERIHRTNLLGMGILPLQFTTDRSPAEQGLTGTETYDLDCDAATLTTGQVLSLTARGEGRCIRVEVRCRIDSPMEQTWFRQGGILPSTLRRMRDADEGRRL